jgi:hypothetical protein
VHTAGSFFRNDEYQMTLSDKSELKNPGPERTVSAIGVRANNDEQGGVIIKFALNDNTKTETLVFLRASASGLAEALDEADQRGYVQRVTYREGAVFAETAPKFQADDFRWQEQDGRIVGEMQVLLIQRDFSFEFVMKDETKRRFLISPKLADVLVEYLHQFRGYL